MRPTAKKKTPAERNGKHGVAFVTGASHGIGYAIARHVAPMFSHLIIASKTKARALAAARRLRDETGREAEVLWGDLIRGRRFAETAKELVRSTVKRIDLLVLNAGYYVEGPLATTADAYFDRTMLDNCHASHSIVSSLLPFVRKSPRGRIIIIGSATAYGACVRFMPTYGIAKWGLRGYALNLRQALMPENIGVTFLAPGGTHTDKRPGEHIPENRLRHPGDIGKLVAATLTRSPRTVIEELIVRPMWGDVYG